MITTLTIYRNLEKYFIQACEAMNSNFKYERMETDPQLNTVEYWIQVDYDFQLFELGEYYGIARRNASDWEYQ